MKLLLLAFVVVLGSAMSHAQMKVMPGSKTPPLGHDTLCFRYTFFANDTLIYRVEGADSVLLFGEKPLIKRRLERIRLVCDSITADGHYALSLTLMQVEEQQFSTSETTNRNTHPWLGRVVYLTVDSLGKRVSNRTQIQSVCPSPGGTFAPILILPMGESCGRQNQSWISQDTLSLVENGFPAPVVAVMNLWRVIDNVDTLGRRYTQIQYTQNGLGTAVVPSSNAKNQIVVHTVINAYGKYSFDTSRDIPYHLFATSELKVDFLMNGESAQTGRHLISTNYHLETLKSSVPNRSLP